MLAVHRTKSIGNLRKLCGTAGGCFGTGQTSNMVVRITQLRRLSHLAWVLIEIVEISELVREQERCVGDLGVSHLLIREGKLCRARSGVVLSLRDRCAQFFHERGRHDAGCDLLGVSHRTLRAVANGARGVKARVLLEEAIEEGIEDCVQLRAERQIALASWERLHGPVRNAELVRACIERVIQPMPPPNDMSPPGKTPWGRHVSKESVRSRAVPQNLLLQDGSSPG